MRMVPTKYVSFGTRQSRTEFLVDRYQGFLRESILDVGCFEAPLRDMLEDVEYVGIDIVGKPDHVSIWRPSTGYHLKMANFNV